MAVEVEIRKEGKGDELLLKSFIGEKLAIGAYDDSWRFQVGKTGENMVVIDPERPGRGIMIHLDPNDRSSVKLKLPIPAAPHDVEVFVDVVTRVAKEWDAAIWTEAGDSMPAGVFATNENNIKDFNDKAFKEVTKNLIDGKAPSFCIFAANWPLYLSAEDAKKLKGDTEAFGKWLSDKQSIDAYYASPRFYMKDGKVIGRYIIMSDCRAIFPKAPSVPYGMTHEGRPLECDDYKVVIGTEEEMIGEIGFEEFKSKLPSAKVSGYDENDILIEELSEDELRSMV